MRHKHSFPADRYGTPTDCKCGMSANDFLCEDIPETEGSKSCPKYHGVRIDCFSTPRWNQGLGCYVGSIRDSEMKGKRKGLTPIGDAKLEQVFKPKEEQSSRSMAHELVRDFHKERRRCVV